MIAGERRSDMMEDVSHIQTPDPVTLRFVRLGSWENETGFLLKKSSGEICCPDWTYRRGDFHQLWFQLLFKRM